MPLVRAYPDEGIDSCRLFLQARRKDDHRQSIKKIWQLLAQSRGFFCASRFAEAASELPVRRVRLFDPFGEFFQMICPCLSHLQHFEPFQSRHPISSFPGQRSHFASVPARPLSSLAGLARHLGQTTPTGRSPAYSNSTLGDRSRGRQHKAQRIFSGCSVGKHSTWS